MRTTNGRHIAPNRRRLLINRETLEHKIWWKTLSARLDSGPAALHRLPESIAHIAEALWMQALEETRRRILIEQRDSSRVVALDKERLEVRSHVLTLREGELDSRLRDRDRSIEELNAQLSALTLTVRKQQVTVDAQTRRISFLQDQLLACRKTQTRAPKTRTLPDKKRKQTARRAALLRKRTRRNTLKPLKVRNRWKKR
jgi:uncharacterized coiled-coil protein SlyX